MADPNGMNCGIYVTYYADQAPAPPWTFQVGPNGATLTVEADFFPRPRYLVFRIPYSVELDAISSNATRAFANDGLLFFTPGVRWIPTYRVGGDLIDDPNVEDQIGEFLEITSSIDRGIAVRWAPGNHDIADDYTAPTEDSIQAYRDVFGPDHYSFRMSDTLFVVMNTPVIDHPEHVSHEWEAQLAFLTDELAHASKSNLDHIIVVGHHPLFVSEPNEPDTYWNLPLERRRVILDLLHGAGVRYGFAGHWHRNAIAIDGPFTQVTSGPVGYPLGDDPSGYRVVDVSSTAVDHRYLPLDES